MRPRRPRRPAIPTSVEGGRAARALEGVVGTGCVFQLSCRPLSASLSRDYGPVFTGRVAERHRISPQLCGVITASFPPHRATRKLGLVASVESCFRALSTDEHTYEESQAGRTAAAMTHPSVHFAARLRAQLDSDYSRAVVASIFFPSLSFSCGNNNLVCTSFKFI
jgi:hypothetical protein